MFPVIGVFLGAAVLIDLLAAEEEYGYGEATLGRIPTHLWQRGGFGLRGEPMSWRRTDPHFGAGYRSISGWKMGMRGPTSSFRYPLPRPWERLRPGWQHAVPAMPHTAFGEDVYDKYGVMTGAGGIRGVPTFTSFTPAQIAAYNREGAAQGLRGASVAPPG